MRPEVPLVSVAICLHESSRYIDDTLESVLAQTFEDFEIVLVDDGSTDGCAQRIERQYRDSRITIVRQRHQGLGVARQESIAHARGEYVAFLDHDDLWLPAKLERQVSAARTGARGRRRLLEFLSDRSRRPDDRPHVRPVRLRVHRP